MKKIILLLTTICFSSASIYAQLQSVQSVVDKAPSDVYVPSSSPTTPSSYKKTRGVGEAFPSTIGAKYVVGKTSYDLQTNGALQNRLMITTNGDIHAAWTMSQEAPVTQNSAFADRGTGYAVNSGGTWSAPPTSSIEATTRTGFGAMAVNGNGNLVYVSHSAAYNIILSERVGGTWNTVQTTLPNTQTAIWPDVATSGNWMYVIASSQDSLTKSNGIRNGYFFSRSNDNGATWIDQMIPMPLVDSIGHYRGGGNSYSISARDSIVVVVFGDFATDLTMIRSNDFGATWTKKLAFDWPIDNYNPTDMTDINNDNIQDTIFTQDGSLDVAIDKNGEVHVAFGSFQMYNDGPANPGYNYYPNTGRMCYYNTIADSVAVVDRWLVLDVTSSQTLISLHHTLCDGDTAVSRFAFYNSDITVKPGDAAYNTISYLTMPQISVNETNDDVYITYTSVMDGDSTVVDNNHPYWFGTMDEGQPYRDVMVLASNDKGASFGFPVNVTRTRHYEEVFPSVPERISGTDLHLLYQGDIEPGTILQNYDLFDPEFQNWMIYQKVAIADIFTESANSSAPCNQFELPLAINEVKLINGKVNIYPNPTSNYVTVELTLENTAQHVSYDLYDITGRIVSSVKQENILQDKVEINVQKLSAGNYILKVNADNAVSTHKVTVR